MTSGQRTPMTGTLALVGAGEFLPSMQAVDRRLLEISRGNHVVVLPTASAPDGQGVPDHWAKMGLAHFHGLGARVSAVMALSRQDWINEDTAAQIAQADLVYFSGGKPDYLMQTLEGTAGWQAVQDVLDRGGVLAGCSAGAMILGAYLPGFRGRRSRGLWQPAFGLVPRAVVIPHFNEIPGPIVSGWIRLRPRGTFAIGIDRDTALVGYGEAWEVLGNGAVTVIQRSGKRSYAPGDQVRLEG